MNIGYPKKLVKYRIIAKRRWIAWFHLGKPVPWKTVVEYRLEKRLVPHGWLLNQQVIVKEMKVSVRPKKDFILPGT